MSEIRVDTISEKTSANGVAIDGVTIKDSVVLTDTISEKTSANGVNIDSLIIKDQKITNMVGMVAQVVSVSKLDSFNTNSTSYVDITGFTASITPSSTSSKY